MKKIILSFIGFTLLSPSQGLADVKTDFNSLGSSQKIMRRAKKLDPKNRYQIVQKREVDRYNRLEFSGQASLNFGGDSYYDSSNYGAGIDYHFTPRWSLGVRYYQYSHKLTSEGERRFSDAAALASDGQNYTIPAIDHPNKSTLAVINYYPLYGKLNIFNQSTVQFDVYVLGGAGTIELDKTGSTSTYTAGGGMGFWLTQHVTTRFEFRYQGYSEDFNAESRKMHLTVGTVSLGILL